MQRTTREILWCVVKAAGLALVVQAVLVVLTFLLAGPTLGTHAVMYFYYPIALLIAVTGVGRSLPMAVFFVIWIPTVGMLCYSFLIGIVWAAFRGRGRGGAGNSGQRGQSQRGQSAERSGPRDSGDTNRY